MGRLISSRAALLGQSVGRAGYGSVMRNKKGKVVAKRDLPSKMCETCERPFTWRKKWESCWDDVKTCSKRCKAERRRKIRLRNRQASGPSSTPNSDASSS